MTVSNTRGRPAATEYSLRYIDCFPLPSGWDWAALSLEFPAPDPVIRGVFRGDPVAILTVASEKATIAANAKKEKNKDA